MVFLVEAHRVVADAGGDAERGGRRELGVEVGREAAERHVIIVDARAERVGTVNGVGAGPGAGD